MPFLSLFHGHDERVPVRALAFGLPGAVGGIRVPADYAAPRLDQSGRSPTEAIHARSAILPAFPAGTIRSTRMTTDADARRPTRAHRSPSFSRARAPSTWGWVPTS